MKRLITTIALALAAPLAFAQAANFPSKPIRIIVPFNAGSGSDTGARVYGEILSKELGQPVIVENRPGGSGLLTIQAVKAAPADGHTIMLASNSPMTVNPVVMKDLPYDPVKDFRPISGLGRGAVAFIVRGDSPAKTVADLVSVAKAEKRSLVVGNYSAGYRLVAAWLGTASGTEVTHVTYKGGAQMMNDIIGSQLDTGAIDFGGAAPLIKEGRLRALAITGDKRHPDFPDVPTMKESGFPDFETYVWTSFFVRAETPDDITKKLADAMQKVLVSPEAKAYQATIPTQPMLFGPEEMRAFQLSEIERFGRVAKAAGIEPQ
jgi:tripartite-type tricarboxylate transporter receptor subunit TctC